MATAKKLPSGAYRVRIFDHYETNTDGESNLPIFHCPNKA